jgi:hypothetical protein
MPTTLKGSGKTRGDWGHAVYAKVTADQSFKEGDLVQFADAGTVSIAATPGNAVGNIRFGIAGAGAADALANDTPIPVYIPRDGAEICLPVYHGTPASAVLTEDDRATAAGQYGITLPIKNVGGVWVADKQNDGTNDCITLVGPDSDDQYNEQYGLFWWAVHHDRALIGDQT